MRGAVMLMSLGLASCSGDPAPAGKPMCPECGGESNSGGAPGSGEAGAGGTPHGDSGGRASAGEGGRSSGAQGESGESGTGGAHDAAGSTAGGAAGTAAAPYVVSTVPELDETNVYPAPLFDGNGEEFVMTLAFSEPMEPRDAFTLAASDHERAANATWSEDRTSVRLAVRPSLASTRPLADETEYRLDVSALTSQAGVELDPNVRLRGGKLSFRTGQYDALLNHSCGHTFFGPFASIGASETPDASAPDIGTTHTEYSIALPEDDAGTFGGFVRARFATAGSYRLYFDSDTQVTVMTSPEAPGEAAALTATPRACPGIERELTLRDVNAGEDFFVFVGPQATATRRVIVELAPEN